MAAPAQSVSGIFPHDGRVTSGDAGNDAASLEAGSALSPWVLAVCSDATRSGLTQPRCSLLEGLLSGGMLQLPETSATRRGGNAGYRIRLHRKDLGR
jgi:hypothetical protein